MITFAHVKWFISENSPPEPTLKATEFILVLLILLAGLFVLKQIDIFMANHKVTKKLDNFFKPYRAFVPLVVRLSTALLLFINAAQGYLLAPNVEATDSSMSSIITAMFVLAGVFIALGYSTRNAVAVFVAGYILVLSEARFVDVIDHVEYLGIGAYLWFRGPGTYSMDAKLKSSLETYKQKELSLPAYRMFVGFGLVALALSEKIFNISGAQEFLNYYHWNLASFVGVDDRLFIIVAGTIELLVGLGLLLNYAPRLLMLIVLGLMTVTAIMLGIEEIYGHLFAVGIVAAIWVNDTKPAEKD